MAGTLKPEFAAFNAEVIPDAFVVQLAAQRALMADSRNKVATKSLHAELVFGVSGSKHIAETLRRFGISADSKHLLVARFDASESDLQAIASLVKGEAAPLSELQALSDAASMNKYYKFTDEEMTVGSLVDAIACRIAARDCM